MRILLSRTYQSLPSYFILFKCSYGTLGGAMRHVYPVLLLFGQSSFYMPLLLLHAVLKGLESTGEVSPVPASHWAVLRVCVLRCAAWQPTYRAVLG